MYLVGGCLVFDLILKACCKGGEGSCSGGGLIVVMSLVRYCCFLQGVKQAKQMLATQQERLAAQQAPLLHSLPGGGGLRLGGEATILIPAVGAYPSTMSDEARECMHQGLRVVHVLSGYMPDYLKVLPSRSTCFIFYIY